MNESTATLTTNTKNSPSEASTNLDSEYMSVIYAITHDLRAPLRGLEGFSKLLLQTYGNELDDQGLQWLSLIAKNAAKTQAMFDDLLIYSRIWSTSHEYEKIDLNTVTNDVINEDIKHSNFQAPIIEIATLPKIKGVKHLWKLLLRNLLINSLTFQPEKQQPKVVIKPSTIDGQWSLQVEDNGIGVKKKDYHKITQVFSRLNSEKQFQGKGMGLAYCRQIVKLHEGSLIFGQSTLGGLAVICAFPSYILV
ncbi:sensor histidine kinase [Spartinivicinus ruber]|uniref:sensor histidine kinase n=1 Tax=Spartinivicinus ruber TaxID=2683272 RepID=UPI0013D064A3|nr:ATP-binding protein [Spartinivicinus ruber]